MRNMDKGFDLCKETATFGGFCENRATVDGFCTRHAKRRAANPGKVPTVCVKCNGTGWAKTRNPLKLPVCSACKGAGKVLA